MKIPHNIHPRTLYQLRIRQVATLMVTQPLKCICTIATLAGIQGTVPARAAVNLISVEHRVWGDGGQSPSNYYEEAGSDSLTRSIGSGDSSGLGYYYAASSASDWSINSFRNASVYNCNAYAKNTYVFKPSSRELSISLRGEISVWWFENEAQMVLTDLAMNSIVSIYQSPSYFYPQSPFPKFTNDMVDYPISWEETVEVNPEHEYEMIIFVGAHRGEGGHGSASLNLTLVPEPGFSLLAGMAVLLMCGCRYRSSEACSLH